MDKQAFSEFINARELLFYDWREKQFSNLNFPMKELNDLLKSANQKETTAFEGLYTKKVVIKLR